MDSFVFTKIIFNFVGVKIVFDMELIINTFGISLNRGNEGFVVAKGASFSNIQQRSILFLGASNLHRRKQPLLHQAFAKFATLYHNFSMFLGK